MENKTLLCLIGASGSGKTTIANELEARYGLKQVQSYTTRPKRSANETGHTFINEDDYPKYIGSIVAYTNLYSNHYFATSKQIDECDVYVIDYIGFEELISKYKGNKVIVSVFIDVPEITRVDRMVLRGDQPDVLVKKLMNDKIVFDRVKEKCDYSIENVDLNKTIDLVYSIYKGDSI